MLNQRYLEYSSAVAQELNTKGFVLLTDFLKEEFTYEQQEHTFRADKHSYTKTQTPQELTQALKRYAEAIGLELTQIATRTFSTGDFTLQDTEEPYEGYEFAYMHAPEWNESYRGEITYTPIDSEPIIVPATHNALAIIKREQEMRSFVKKVTHYAQKHQLTVTLARSE